MTEAPPPTASPRRVLLVLLLLGLVALGGAIFAYSRIRYAQNTLLDLGHVPAFALTDADSTRVTDRDLEGKIWIADFFFTTCRGLCPTLTGRMADLQAALADYDDLRLVSITVDPDHDTPSVLAAYARDHGADRDRWQFLTGEKTSLLEMIRTGFLLPVRDASGNAKEPILHSSRLLLVDRKGEIRGAFDALDETAMEDLVLQAKRLLDRDTP